MEIIGLTSNGTTIFAHHEAHPHRPDLAAEAISKMVVPSEPADPTDRSQTRYCETIDLGRKIGKNHLIELRPGDATTMFKRGDRNYESRIAIFRKATPETRITSVCFWDAEENHWVLYTNFEGEEGLPEPGCDRYNEMPEEKQDECDKFWDTHALVLEGKEKEQMIKTLIKQYQSERDWLDSYFYGGMSSLEWNSRDQYLQDYYDKVISKL